MLIVCLNKSKILEMDYRTEKARSKAGIDTLIRNALFSELPGSSYDDKKLPQAKEV